MVTVVFKRKIELGARNFAEFHLRAITCREAEPIPLTSSRLHVIATLKRA